MGRDWPHLERSKTATAIASRAVSTHSTIDSADSARTEFQKLTPSRAIRISIDRQTQRGLLQSAAKCSASSLNANAQLRNARLAAGGHRGGDVLERTIFVALNDYL